MNDFVYDLRHALRQMAKRPAFSVAALLTLALGIGANAAIFSVVNGVLLQPLPFAEPDRLCFLTREGDVSIPDGIDWRRDGRAFQQIALFLRSWAFDLSGGGEPERLRGAVVEPEFFGVLGKAPLLGRVLTAEDDRRGGERVGVISEGFWKRRFGGDPGVVGRVITLADHATTIVGVMPQEFDFLHDGLELWVPAAQETPWALDERGTNNFDAIGRLRAGVTIDAARTEMLALTTRLAKEYPKTNSRKLVEPLLLLDFMVGPVQRALFVLLGAVGLVVLLASVNLAGLLLARSAARQQEFALRRVLGASRSRVVRQILTEGLLLAVFGGLLGLAAAYWGRDLLRAVAPETLPRSANIVIDGAVLRLGLLTSLLAGLVFSLVPAAHVLSIEPGAQLSAAGRGLASSRLQHRVLSLLVTSEVALAFVLLVGSGLLLRSFESLLRVPLGFDPGSVLVGSLVLPESRYATKDPQTTAFRGILEGVAAIPGVEAAALVIGAPLEPRSGIGNKILVEGRPREAAGQERGARARPVLGDYFRALRLPVRTGRPFTDADDERAPLVAVVNERFAKEFFPAQSPIGQRIAWRDWGAKGAVPAWMTIVGVAADVKAETLDAPDSPAVYTPYPQRLPEWQRFATLVARTKVAPASLAAAISKAVLSVDPTLPLAEVSTLESRRAEAVAQPRFNTLALGAFAAVALLLAVQGLYAILAFGVEERRREIGVRMALGATRADVVGQVTRLGLSLAALGLALGGLAALAFGRILTALLYGVEPNDPLTFCAVALLLLATAALACAVPARRAARLDPMEALRAE